MAAKGVNLGKPTMDFLAKKGLTQYNSGIKALIEQYGTKIRVPIDVAINIYGDRHEIVVDQLPTEYSILDLGSKTIEIYTSLIMKAKSIVVSGPMGVYENPQFNRGTKEILTAIAESKAFSLAGGGNTIAAIQEYGLTSKISYISTAGGALIEFLMGKKLPGVVALETATQTKKR
jgi:phosphoglycerate kinase